MKLRTLMWSPLAAIIAASSGVPASAGAQGSRHLAVCRVPREPLQQSSIPVADLAAELRRILGGNDDPEGRAADATNAVERWRTQYASARGPDLVNALQLVASTGLRLDQSAAISLLITRQLESGYLDRDAFEAAWRSSASNLRYTMPQAIARLSTNRARSMMYLWLCYELDGLAPVFAASQPDALALMVDIAPFVEALRIVARMGSVGDSILSQLNTSVRGAETEYPGLGFFLLRAWQAARQSI